MNKQKCKMKKGIVDYVEFLLLIKYLFLVRKDKLK